MRFIHPYTYTNIQIYTHTHMHNITQHSIAFHCIALHYIHTYIDTYIYRYMICRYIGAEYGDTCTCTCTYTYTYTSTYTYIHACMHTYMHTCIDACMLLTIQLSSYLAIYPSAASIYKCTIFAMFTNAVVRFNDIPGSVFHDIMCHVVQHPQVMTIMIHGLFSAEISRWLQINHPYYQMTPHYEPSISSMNSYKSPYGSRYSWPQDHS